MIAGIYLLALSFLAGNLFVHSLATLPSRDILVVAVLIVFAFSSKYWLRICGGFVAGFCWTLVVASAHSDDILPAQLDNQTLTFIGHIASIPNRYGDIATFIFRPDKKQENKLSLPQNISLKIYRDDHKGLDPADQTLKLNTRLEVTAKLKQPFGYANPNIFDYEKWLFAKRIGARGYIKSYRHLDISNRLTSIADLRQSLIDRLRTYQSSFAHTESIMALGLGFAGALSKDENDVLISSGVRHLFAISGLHINLIFALFFLIIRYFWSRFLLPHTHYPAHSAALLAALPAAACYAFLAGFSLPTQRALVALLSLIVIWHSRNLLSAGQILCVVMLAILLYDPLSTLSISFWLSFGAVALIVFFLLTPSSRRGWQRWFGLQIYLSLGMALLSMSLFSRGSFTALVANLFAVPYISFLMLPMSLLALGALMIGETLSYIVIRITDALFSAFWWVVEWLTQHGLEWYWQPPRWIFAISIVCLLLFIFLLRFKHKAFSLLLLLPFIFNQNAHFPAHGTFKVDFFDVGQGLSVLVRTHSQTLLYDTGPYFRSGFNTSEAVIIPYLRSLGIRTLDMLVISHNDNDHAGGVSALLDKVEARVVLTGEKLALPKLNAQACRAGQSWNWDGVQFDVLHPDGEIEWVGNNASCVLRIYNSKHSVLLTADIEASAERHIVMRNSFLKSEVLLIPHHGSRTSSTFRFIKAVSPKLAIVTSGYKNQYKFPHKDISSRYTARGISIQNTADSGMISLYLPNDTPLEISAFRKATRRYWQHRSADSLLK